MQVLGAYGNDMDHLIKPIREHEPQFDSKWVVDLQSPNAAGACPPYFIYVDHENKEVSMYIRGLNLLHRRDYVVLFKNRKGEKVRCFWKTFSCIFLTSNFQDSFRHYTRETLHMTCLCFWE